MTKKIYLETLKSVLGRSISHYFSLLTFTCLMTFSIGICDTSEFPQTFQVMIVIL